MKLSKELKELISKWKKILKLEDWDLNVQLECPKKYMKIEKAVGIEPGISKGMNTSIEEMQYSLIVLNADAKEQLELYLVHEFNHSILNEMADYISYLIEMQKNDEIKAVLKVRREEILEKLVWKFTKILLELDGK